MRLSEFIHIHTEQIIDEWEVFAQSLDLSLKMDREALRDHIEDMLEFIINDIETSQTTFEQSEKSKGYKEEEKKDSAAQIHGQLRLEKGFDIVQVAAEYRALRASVIELWGQEFLEPQQPHYLELIRFNEAIDQILMESITRVNDKVEHSRDIFIGILGHDLRNPLSAIITSAELIVEEGALNDEQAFLLSQIDISAKRIDEIIKNLLELTRLHLGEGIPIARVPTDIARLARQITEEVRASYTDRLITFETTGELKGNWDKGRIGQVFSNLIGNAVQHSFKNSPIHVKVVGEPDKVLFSVHNEGVPIPLSEQENIFSSLVRIQKKENTASESGSLGLGLYIAKEIVVAHGGRIDVSSSKEDGTVFTVSLPRMSG